MYKTRIDKYKKYRASIEKMNDDEFDTEKKHDHPLHAKNNVTDELTGKQRTRLEYDEGQINRRGVIAKILTTVVLIVLVVLAIIFLLMEYL